MARRFEYRISDFSGGRNGGVSPSSLSPRELAEVRNYYVYGRHLIRRQGSIKITITTPSELITGLFALKLSTGSWALIALHKTGISRVASAVLNALTNADSVTIPTSESRWQARQYKEVGYAVRQGVTGMLRFDRNNFYQAGIAKPTSSTTLASAGGGGSTEAGAYIGVVRFVDLDTDNESDPSPVSNTLTIVDGDIRRWTNIPISTDAKVNARRLYLTLPNQTGEYYLVATIADNTTTSYDEGASLADFGAQASFRNGTPPELQFRAIALWKERSWLSDSVDVYYSEIGLVECFDEDNFIQVYPDDGHQIIVLHEFGDRLVVGKTNGIHFITGTDRSDFAVSTLSDRHGCIARDSMKSAEGLLFWYSGENVYLSDGSTVRAISDPQIRDILDEIPESYKANVVAAILPRLGLYLLSVPQDSTGVPTKLLVYNYRRPAWSYFDYPLGAPWVMGDFYDEQLEQVVIASFYSQFDIYNLTPEPELDVGEDAGTPITASFTLGALDFGAPGHFHAVKNLLVECQDIGANMTVELLRDQEASASKSRSIYLYQGRRLKRYSMSGFAEKSLQTQLRFTYTARPAQRVEGVTLQGVVFVDKAWQEPPK